MGVTPNRVVDSGEIGAKEVINYTLRLWIDYDATNEEAGGKVFKGKLRVEVTMLEGDPVSDTIVDNVGENGSTYDDGEDTFITGTDPNNYIWYSGKLWRAVSINNEAKTTKLITQWNMSSIEYSSGGSAFKGSYMEKWLNDTSVDGFLGNLREPEKFIKMDSKWNATLTTSTSTPAKTTMVEDAVGLLNAYEYTMSYKGTTEANGYLNNDLSWWLLTPYSSYQIRYIYSNGALRYDGPYSSSIAGGYGIRPSIVLRSDVKIVSGTGTESDPYRLSGDSDTELNGVKLNTRYSGEYIRFGVGVNNLYRIVSHENGTGTKIVSAVPLKVLNSDDSSKVFSSNGSNKYSTSSGVGSFLNSTGNGFLNPSNGYLTSEQINMVDNGTWYQGVVSNNGGDYRTAKYTSSTSNTLVSTTTLAKVGLLRYGELFSGISFNVDDYDGGGLWTITRESDSSNGLWFINFNSFAYTTASGNYNLFQPSMNLKENVVITGGDGTKINPFTIELNN